MNARLHFEGGTIAITLSDPASSQIPQRPYIQWDKRSNSYRALAFRYRELLEDLKTLDLTYEDWVLDPLPCPPLPIQILKELREYQREALDRWAAGGSTGGRAAASKPYRGAIVLPTGAGKTFVGLGAIAHLQCPAFIVVPTLDLVNQWQRELQAHFKDVPIGEYTGHEKRLEAITVATYDSAYIYADKLGNKFPLIVFDEVHHLAAEGYRHIAEFFASPYRLGLTATYEREDELHEVLSELLGGKIFEIRADELTGKYLSTYSLEKILVDLTPQERESYERHNELFQGYLKKHRLRLRHPRDFERLVLRSGSDPEAWAAVRARNEAQQISFNAQNKLKELRRLLIEHRGDRIIIFTRFNELVYRISENFFIPAITYKTDRDERGEALQGFRDGTYQAIVSSQVLDEGVDVPEANVGIILSGTGSVREFIQRLGRILRPREGKQAVLYELVSRQTGEVRTSYRRKRQLRLRREPSFDLT